MKFSELATTYDAIAAAGGKQGKVERLADLLRGLDEKTLRAAAHLTLGEVVDPALADRIEIGPGTVRDVLAALSNQEPEVIERAVKETGDMSEVAAQVASGTDVLTVANVWGRANRAVKRDEDRTVLLRHIYEQTTADGARYFTRMVLNKMRIGVGHGTFIDAIAEAFDVDTASVQRLYALTSDIGLAAIRAKRGARSLAQTGLALFRPYQFMNAHKVDDLDAVFDQLGTVPVLFERKYDGARLQIHIKDSQPPEVRLYSRRLNDVTDSLPDVVEALQTAWSGGDAILEGEAVAFDSSLKDKQPFQAVLTRLGRKHRVEEQAAQIPLVLYLFDALFYDGESWMALPQQERRERLRTLFRSSRRVMLTDALSINQQEPVQQFFDDALEAGHEGLMAKDPEASYLPGQRTHRWMKLKPEFESLDVVVVGGIWGSGSRKGLLSSLLVAVRDEDRFKTAGKVGTGFTEDELRELTDVLQPRIITSEGRRVTLEPDLVIEVDFQDIQRTNAYEAGYALRIPRFVQQRTDKGPREADTLDRLAHLYRQRH